MAGLQLQQMLHDRRFQIGALVAAGAGAYTLYRRSHGGASGGVAGLSTGPGAAGTADTTSTDLGGMLSAYGTQLDAFGQQLSDTLDAIKAGPVAQPAPTVPPAPAPAPAPAAPKPTSVSDVVVAPWRRRNTPWNSTLSGIAAHEHTTVSALLRLNPSIHNPNVIHTGQKIRVR